MVEESAIITLPSAASLGRAVVAGVQVPPGMTQAIEHVPQCFRGAQRPPAINP